jgi:anti-sigma regulatory factor (Ser/Thr protein kinase)
VKAVSAKLPRTTESIRTARRLVHDHTAALDPRLREDAGLMVSELVTNALRHGRGPVTLRLTADSDGVRVEVADRGSGPVLVNAAPGAEGGWGLRLVDRLADAWGVEQGSTVVWFWLGHSRR